MTKRRDNFCLKAPFGKTNCANALYLVTYPNTEPTHNAFVLIPGNKGIVVDTVMLTHCTGKTIFTNAILVSKFLQNTFSSPNTGHTVIGVIGKQEFHYGFPQPVEFRTLSLH
jgi:hypothetical protein